MTPKNATNTANVTYHQLSLSGDESKRQKRSQKLALTSHELMLLLEQLDFTGKHLFVVLRHQLSKVQFANAPLLLIKRSLLTPAQRSDCKTG